MGAMFVVKMKTLSAPRSTRREAWEQKTAYSTRIDPRKSTIAPSEYIKKTMRNDMNLESEKDMIKFIKFII